MSQRTQHAERSHCPIACALDLIGDRWTLLVIRDMLLLGRHEFSEFLESGEGISTNILADRLRGLTDAGLIRSIRHPDSARRKLYFLTAKGKALIEPIYALALWSARWLPDRVVIPPERMALARKGPEAFSTAVLGALEEWERRFGIPPDEQQVPG